MLLLNVCKMLLCNIDFSIAAAAATAAMSEVFVPLNILWFHASSNDDVRNSKSPFFCSFS